MENNYITVEDLIKKNESGINKKRSERVLKDLHDLSKKYCIPFTSEETYIVRSLEGIIDKKTKEELEKELNINSDQLKSILSEISSILLMYIKDKETLSGINVDDEGKDVILDLDISRKALYGLRLYKCYYIEDAYMIDPDTYRIFFSEDKDKIINAINDKYIYRKD